MRMPGDSARLAGSSSPGPFDARVVRVVEASLIHVFGRCVGSTDSQSRVDRAGRFYLARGRNDLAVVLVYWDRGEPARSTVPWSWVHFCQQGMH